MNGRCRLCDSADRKIIATEKAGNDFFSIARCLRCAGIYVPEDCGSVSPEYTRLVESDIDDSLLWLQGRHKQLAFLQCLARAEYFLQGAEHPRLLDVGCGTGGWLEFVGTRWSKWGFDASAAQSAYARRRLPNIRQATSIDDYMSQLDNAPLEFDFITMWDVLEHIRQPVPFLSDIRRRVASQGLLFVSVPNSLPMIVKSRFSRVWPGFTWAPREHVVYYSPTTLRHLCRDAGFRVLESGSVKVYPRSPSVFEAIRRTGFSLTARMPRLAPQIYVFAQPC